MKNKLIVLPALLLFAGCQTSGENVEGDEPGECDDGADNDQDGLVDCYDLGCSNAGECADDDDHADDDDAADDDVADDDHADDDDQADDDDDQLDDDDQADDDTQGDDDSVSDCPWDGVYAGEAEVVVDNPMMGVATSTCVAQAMVSGCIIDGELDCTLPPYTPLILSGELTYSGTATGTIEGTLQYVGTFVIDWTGTAGGDELQGQGIYYYGLLSVSADFDMEN